jgi:hypothetical protein
MFGANFIRSLDETRRITYQTLYSAHLFMSPRAIAIPPIAPRHQHIPA